MREAQRIENLRSASELAAVELARARKVHEVFDELLEELAPRPILGARPTALQDVESEIELLDDELRTTRLECESLRVRAFATHAELTREMERGATGDPLTWMRKLHTRIAEATPDEGALRRRAEDVRSLEAMRASLVTLRDELKATPTSSGKLGDNGAS